MPVAPLRLADSGPLIALARFDLLIVPWRLFDALLVRVTVWNEVTRDPRPAERPAQSAALAQGLLRVEDDPQPLRSALAEARLGAGERSALALKS